MKMPGLPSDILPLTRRITRPMSRDKSDTLLLLVSCTLVLAPHAAHLPGWIILICSTLLLWRGWITFRGNRMPSHWLLLPIAALTIISAYQTYGTFLGRDIGVASLVLLLSFKLLEMRAKRDLFVVMLVSFFLMLANFFYSQTIGTALLMVIALIAILTTQLSFQYTGVVPPFKQRLRLGALIFALAVPLALVLFVLFQRIQGPLWGMPSDAHGGRSGLSETMSPGNISQLALSDEVAFRAKFIDPAPPKSKLYWRGAVLGDYDGRTWTALRRMRVNDPIILRPRGTPIRYQVTLEPNGHHWLFALELPIAAPQITANQSGITPDLQVLATQPISQRVRYDATSYVAFDLQPNEPAAALQQWLQLPPGYNPRALEFAAKLRNQTSNPVDRVNAVLKFFSTENFSYTLEPPLLGQHAVDEFLFSTRAGFCEHYASSFVVLMRALNIPARVVTGYQGGEINPVDGFMAIRQSDAHAWAEVWLEQRGWLRVDPTAAVAPDRIQLNLASAIPRRLFGGLMTINFGQDSLLGKLRVFRENWDAATNAWNQWVLNYTPERQKNFIQSLGFNEVDWRTLITLMLALGAVVMLIIGLPLVMNRPQIDPVAAIYQSLCQQMARHGCARAIHEGPRAYGARLTAVDSPLAQDKKAAAARFLRLYEEARYGTLSNAPSAATLSQLKSLLTECR